MKALILAASFTLATLTPAANAAPSEPGMTVMSSVGQWIAEQGNAALREIREELKRDLKDRLRPLHPEQPDTQR